MSDPGWDVPGVDRDAASGGLLTDTSPAASTADGSGSRRARRGPQDPAGRQRLRGVRVVGGRVRAGW